MNSDFVLLASVSFLFGVGVCFLIFLIATDPRLIFGPTPKDSDTSPVYDKTFSDVSLTMDWDCVPADAMKQTQGVPANTAGESISITAHRHFDYDSYLDNNTVIVAGLCHNSRATLTDEVFDRILRRLNKREGLFMDDLFSLVMEAVKSRGVIINHKFCFFSEMAGDEAKEIAKKAGKE